MMANLPTGNVTFLFTDIQGSTKLWERDAAVMRTAVEGHLALLGDAITAHGGVHFKTVGDAVQAAFHTPDDAVAAAVDGQRALAATSWPETGSLLVRMAIHQGQAEPVRGDYLAPCLNRLARLLGTGWGGQVLLTDLARAAVRTWPEGVTIRDLGRHRLRDLLEPEQVAQLEIAGLPADFPPLKSLEGFPTNLPQQPNAIIGREAEIAQVSALLTEPTTRLLTITGPGGVGKTRLATQVGADLLEQFVDGVWFIELGTLTAADQLMARLAADLGIREGSGMTLDGAITEYLRPRAILLILDNVEHLPGAAPLIQRLGDAAPQLRVLATSRRPLNLRAERTFALAPLPVPGLAPRRGGVQMEVVAQTPAVALFLQFAQARDADFSLTPANAAPVAAICTRLDGLPLAIELAAAQVVGLTPAEILAELDNRFDLLIGGAADLLPHQQTLEAAIAWSYDLLTPGEQALFRRLSVFRGGAARPAIEAVAPAAGALGGRLAPALLSLTANNLLRRSDAGEGAESRYTLLESLRHFGADRLREAGEDAATGAAFVTHFAHLAREAGAQLAGPEQRGWLARLRADQDNLHAALDAALAGRDYATAEELITTLWRYWRLQGSLSEGRNWVERVIRQGERDGAAFGPRVFLAAGTLADENGDYAAAQAWLDHGLEVARARGDRQAELTILHNSGNVALALGDHRRAAGLFTRSQDIAREMGDALREAHATFSLGAVAHHLDDVALARASYGGALAIWERAGDDQRVAAALANLTLLLAPLPEHREEAQRHGERCLALSRDLQFVNGTQAALTGLGFVAYGGGAYGKAIDAFTQSLQLCQEIEDPSGAATAQGNLALAYAAAGDPAQALPLAQACLRAFLNLRDAVGIATALETLAQAWGHAGEPEAAVAAHAAA
ncbi:MAG: tetratricopeptide repeat protein, partial [Thermomicrobiales bacterium]